MQKIGITERGDAGIDFSWTKNIDECEFAILITKNINKLFISKVLHYKEKVIIHATITGFGGTVLEKNVPTLESSYTMLSALIDAGFPKEQIVLRVDPIIPTSKGIANAKKVLETISSLGIKRCRISFLDMYNHVKIRFAKNNVPLPYDTFTAPKEMIELAINTLENSFGNLYTFEACAEYVKCRVGCVSHKDADILGKEIIFESNIKQRKNCLCNSNKFELLNTKHPCIHNCLYCYWQDQTPQKE